MLELIRNAAVAVIGSLIFAMTANAASVSVYLDQSNRNKYLPNGTEYLKVTISDGVDGAIDFLVETLEPLQNLAGTDWSIYGIQAFAFNFGTSGATADNIILPYEWQSEVYKNFKGFGEFDVMIRGNKNNRKDPMAFSIVGIEGDTIADYLNTLSTGDAKHGNWLFGARVAGFDPENSGKPIDGAEFRSAKFAGGSVVPIPPAIALMISGLMVLGGMATKRRDGRLLITRGDFMELLDEQGEVLKTYPLETYGWSDIEICGDGEHCLVSSKR